MYWNMCIFLKIVLILRVRPTRNYLISVGFLILQKIEGTLMGEGEENSFSFWATSETPSI